MPVVSVLMASHRDTPFLRAAIGSVLGQTLADLELILVDDGAGLDDAAIGEAARDPRLRRIGFPENRGIPMAHNAAMAAARGEFIALLDHDDLMLPARLERQVARLRAEPSLGLVSSLAATIDEEGRVTGREFALVGQEDQSCYSAYSTPVVTPAYTGRREVFAALPYREAFSLTADFDFIARAAERYALGAVPEVLLHYRRHAAQATQEYAAGIERQRGQVRLCTARRRAGRDEGDLTAGIAARAPADESLAAAQRALAEGFHALTAFQARRALALDRRLRVAGRAGWLGLQAMARARGVERGLATRMFFQGPVRALSVAPA
jgi:glycosyltransferase involved in cell wall biosynthesis